MNELFQIGEADQNVHSNIMMLMSAATFCSHRYVAVQDKCQRSKEKQDLLHNINNKDMLMKGSRDLCQQHSRCGQGGICDDCCGVDSAGESVLCSNLADKHGI